MFLQIRLPSIASARSICDRSVLIKGIYLLYSHHPQLQEVVEDVKTKWRDIFQAELLDSKISWSVNVDTFCRALTMEQKEQSRLMFNFLDFPGKVKIADPDLRLWLLLDFNNHKHIEIERISEVPAYFGRLLAVGGMLEQKKKFDLKKRAYIGPTSLDHSLALILANLTLIQPFQFVLDPFVGTASILVACSYFGAKCTGTDIDPRVLRGEMYAGKADRKTDTSKRDIFANFSMYGLEVPELIRLDNHVIDRHVVCKREPTSYSSASANPTSGMEVDQEGDHGGDEGMFDAIITDPPYGIRAGARKSGKKEGVAYSIASERRDDHVPATQTYPVEEVMLDLLHAAARLLVV